MDKPAPDSDASVKSLGIFLRRAKHTHRKISVHVHFGRKSLKQSAAQCQHKGQKPHRYTVCYFALSVFTTFVSYIYHLRYSLSRSGLNNKSVMPNTQQTEAKQQFVGNPTSADENHRRTHLIPPTIIERRQPRFSARPGYQIPAKKRYGETQSGGMRVWRWERARLGPVEVDGLELAGGDHGCGWWWRRICAARRDLERGEGERRDIRGISLLPSYRRLV
jgi:hypothetical protein